MSPVILLLILIATASAALAHLLWGPALIQPPIFWLAAFRCLPGSLCARAYARRCCCRPLACRCRGRAGGLVLLMVVARLRV
ncbi:MAG: hypothetical protein U0Z44_03310 [Kouleothrix sp.]